jgi:hypothetical protein
MLKTANTSSIIYLSSITMANIRKTKNNALHEDPLACVSVCVYSRRLASLVGFSLSGHRLRAGCIWRWRWYVPPKRRFAYGLHGVISQKMAMSGHRLHAGCIWRWRWYVPPKRRFAYGLHGVISQKMAMTGHRLHAGCIWRWRWYVPPKRRFTYKLHGAITQKVASSVTHLSFLCTMDTKPSRDHSPATAPMNTICIIFVRCARDVKG